MFTWTRERYAYLGGERDPDLTNRLSKSEVRVQVESNIIPKKPGILLCQYLKPNSIPALETLYFSISESCHHNSSASPLKLRNIKQIEMNSGDNT